MLVCHFVCLFSSNALAALFTVLWLKKLNFFSNLYIVMTWSQSLIISTDMNCPCSLH